MNALSIRLAGADDVGPLVALNREVQDLHVAGAPSRYHHADPAEVAGWFAARVAEGGTWLCERDRAAAGYLCVKVEARAANPFAPAQRVLLVDQIGVHAPFRGRGIGRALMDHAFALAEQDGCDRVELDVLAFNADAVAFYAALGYAPVRHRLARDLGRRRAAP